MSELERLIEEHENNLCNCDLTDFGMGMCLAGQYINSCITLDETLEELGVEKTITDNSIHNMDGITLLEQIYEEYGDNSIDMILLDLPYSYKGKARVTANKWDLPIDIEKLFVLSSKLLTKTGTLVMTATNPFSAYLIMESIHLKDKEDYKDIDFVNYKYEWIWEKDNGSNFVHVKHQPFRVHEQILVFGKAPTTYNKNDIYMKYTPQFTYGKPYKMDRDMSDVENLDGFKGRTGTDNKDGKRYPRSVQKVSLERGLHPTQKPTKLFDYLIETHCPKEGLVVDICAGSGTTAISCINTHRRYIVNDITEKYFEVMKERVLNVG